MSQEFYEPESPREKLDIFTEEEILKNIFPLQFQKIEDNDDINLDKLYYVNDTLTRKKSTQNDLENNKEEKGIDSLIDDYEAAFNKLGSNQNGKDSNILNCYNYNNNINVSYEKEDYNIPFFIKNIVSENNFFSPINNENNELVVKVEEINKKDKFKKINFSNSKKVNKNIIETPKKDIKAEVSIKDKKPLKRGPYKKKEKAVEKICTEDKCFPFSTGKGLFNNFNPPLYCTDVSAYEENEINEEEEEELDLEKKSDKNEENIYLNEQINLINNSLIKFKTKKYFISSNGKKKRVKKKRKFKPDDIRKKIKARFHKMIKNIINENLKKAGSKELFDFLPQSFIGNVSKKINHYVMDLTYKEILSTNFNNEIKTDSANIKVDMTKYLKNQNVLKYLEDNPQISKRAGFDIVQKMKYKEILNIYFNSAQFENSIIQLKAENESLEYIKEYIYRAKTYLKFYSSLDDNKKKNNDEKVEN